MTVEKEPPFKDPACICPYGIGSSVRLYGIDMGREWVRLDTVDGCPVHAPKPPPQAKAVRKRSNYDEARASMEAAGIDPDAFDSAGDRHE